MQGIDSKALEDVHHLDHVPIAIVDELLGIATDVIVLVDNFVKVDVTIGSYGLIVNNTVASYESIILAKEVLWPKELRSLGIIHIFG